MRDAVHLARWNADKNRSLWKHAGDRHIVSGTVIGGNFGYGSEQRPRECGSAKANICARETGYSFREGGCKANSGGG